MSRGVRTGLVILGLLSLGDCLALLASDGEFPPLEVAAAVTALGIGSLILLVPAWRGSRAACIALIVLRLISAALAVPALVVTDVPAPVRVLTAAIVVLTLLGCSLTVPLATGQRRRDSAGKQVERRT